MNKVAIAHLKQQARSNVYTAHGEVHAADCVIGFSFGYLHTSKGVKPGKSNEQLAKLIETNFAGIPLILQFEINDALKGQKADLVIRQSRRPGEYLGSTEVASQALEYMKNRGWVRAIIVTHPAMEARNDALCQKLGIDTIAPPELESIEYDSRSAQPWTRNKQAWWGREQMVIDRCNNEGWL